MELGVTVSRLSSSCSLLLLCCRSSRHFRFDAISDTTHSTPLYLTPCLARHIAQPPLSHLTGTVRLLASFLGVPLRFPRIPTVCGAHLVDLTRCDICGIDLTLF